MAKSIIYKHYQRILTQWPVDRLRPELSFQKIIQRRIDTQLKPSNQAQTTIPESVPFDEQGQLEQVNVLYSLLENRYKKKYPLSEKMMRPASNPDYYDKLVKELDEAPDRSRFQSWLNRWKGFLRFS